MLCNVLSIRIVLQDKMLAGILVDVSESTTSRLQLNVKPEDRQITRMQPICRAILNIAENDIDYKDDQEMFVFAFRVDSVATCDLLSLLAHVKSQSRPSTVGYEPIIHLLKSNGFPSDSKYK